MSDDDDIDRYATADAVVARQGPAAALPVHVAPATQQQTNTLRPLMTPLACWRLNEALFDFDASFVEPGVRRSAPRFAALVREHAGALASVFGHADPTGRDDYNKTLSGRRAAAVYGLLTRDVGLWQRLWDTPFGDDRWGTRAVQAMLGELPDPSADPPGPYYAGAVTGVDDGPTRAAIRAFQADHGLSVDGVVGPQTTGALFPAYMDAVCVDEAGAPFVMTPEQFVGRGEAPGGKGAYQGCGEFNPVLLLARAEQQRHDAGQAPKAERDARNAPNRRALVFLFRPLVPLAHGNWPCPTADEGPGGCKAMFWPDADQRRAPGEAQREYRSDLRTMACSWYDRFARLSPCEGRVYTRISVTLRDRLADVIAGAPYRMTAGDRTRAGRAADGLAVITVPGVPARCTVEWSFPEDPGIGSTDEPPVYTLDLHVQVDVGTDEEQAKKRLHNIGYPEHHPLDVALRAFQADHGLAETGALDAATRAALIEVHGTLATPTAGPDPEEQLDG